jgi:hypothetical protein
MRPYYWADFVLAGDWRQLEGGGELAMEIVGASSLGQKTGQAKAT